MPADKPSKPLTMPAESSKPSRSASTMIKTPEPSTVEVKTVANYIGGDSPLEYCQNMLKEYGQESDIPVDHDYWRVKRRIS